MGRVCVVVVGEIGRSPRMQYHALSLAANHEVFVVAQSGKKGRTEFEEHPRIHQHPLPQVAVPPGWPRLAYVAFAPVKALVQALVLLWTLLVSVPGMDAVLVQNPPAVPALGVVWAVARVRGARMIVDWHNLGYTLLALNLGTSHLLVRLYRWYEWFFGRRGDGHLCVTKAMASLLQAPPWGIPHTVVHYDAAPDFFRPLTAPERHRVYADLAPLFDPLRAQTGWDPRHGDDGRPFLLVSSTSWTPDEDFGLMLGALEAVDRQLQSGGFERKVVVVITGSGHLKEHYLGVIASMALRHIHILTAWLEAADYPRLLGAADLGVSLHRSSSGVDLPMKVVDMFGCGLPVAQVEYACINELVHDGVNGVLFTTEAQLARTIMQFLEPGGSDRLRALSRNISDRPAVRTRWAVGWEQHVAPVVRLR